LDLGRLDLGRYSDEPYGVQPTVAPRFRGRRGVGRRLPALPRRFRALADLRHHRPELRDGDGLAHEAQPRLDGPPLVVPRRAPADHHDWGRAALDALEWPRPPRVPSIPA
jgi:hypothetical protein